MTDERRTGLGCSSEGEQQSQGDDRAAERDAGHRVQLEGGLRNVACVQHVSISFCISDENHATIVAGKAAVNQ